MLTELRWIARIFFLVFVVSMISVTYLIAVGSSPGPVVAMFFLLFASGLTAGWAHSRVLDNEPVANPEAGDADFWDGTPGASKSASPDDF